MCDGTLFMDVPVAGRRANGMLEAGGRQRARLT